MYIGTWILPVFLEGQRMRLAQLKLVKPQISDEQILTFFDECEKFRNNEIRINNH